MSYPIFGIGPYDPYGIYRYGLIDSYGSLNLTETSPPQSFTEPLDLSDVKAYLRVDSNYEDDTILGLISAAREQAEILQGRDLVIKQWDLSYDYWPDFRIGLRAPLISVESVKYKDSAGAVTTMVENTDYIVETAKQPGYILTPYNKTWPTFTPWPSSAITVSFRSGYLPTAAFWFDSGARVKIGMKLLISAWFEQRVPFATGIAATAEYPFAITSCLSTGALERP